MPTFTYTELLHIAAFARLELLRLAERQKYAVDKGDDEYCIIIDRDIEIAETILNKVRGVKS